MNKVILSSLCLSMLLAAPCCKKEKKAAKKTTRKKSGAKNATRRNMRKNVDAFEINLDEDNNSEEKATTKW